MENTMERCILFNIQRFSLDDGPGIRTTVFFKGCPLRCIWCHNPESQEACAQLLFHADRCRSCGACVAACPKGARRMEGERMAHDFAKCDACGLCERVCLRDANEVCGKTWTVDEVVRFLSRDEAFYAHSGGGVTFSGGEPLCQGAFLGTLAKACHERGWHTALDTAGFFPADCLDGELLSNIDLVLYDIKFFDASLHRRYTGVDNELILANLARLSRAGKAIWIRLPFIQGITMKVREIDNISKVIGKARGIERIELVPYHAYGEAKYNSLGRAYACVSCVPSVRQIDQAIARFARNGLKVTCPVRGEGGDIHARPEKAGGPEI